MIEPKKSHLFQKTSEEALDKTLTLRTGITIYGKIRTIKNWRLITRDHLQHFIKFLSHPKIQELYEQDKIILEKLSNSSEVSQQKLAQELETLSMQSMERYINHLYKTQSQLKLKDSSPDYSPDSSKDTN